MGEKLLIGPMSHGLRNDRTAFSIDNDSFPTLINAYQWRGRIKRKRGTKFICRLQRFIGTTDGAGNATITISPQPIGTGLSSFVIGTDVFYDPGTTANPGVQTLLTNSSGTGTLDRVNGILTITGSKIATQIIYFPTLPVMGLEDVTLGVNQFPGTLGFDTTYSYNIPTASPFTPYDVSFYKNPSTATYLGYIQKGTWTPTWWNGQNYQQFWTVNYQGALWATNGLKINTTFDTSSIGMQFVSAPSEITDISGITNIPGPPNGTEIQFTIPKHGLVVGDFLFFNEFDATTYPGLNLQTGYVVVRVNNNNVIVRFPNAVITGPAGTSNPQSGIAQYLTSRTDTTKDCLRWYDGDPTGGAPPTPSSTLGWVNFMPPLSNMNFSIDDETPAIYYLVGARMIFPFKDRLLFFGPIIQTSSGAPIYLQDTVIYSQNGTPYYTASFTGNPLLATTVFFPILTPTGFTASPVSYFEDETGYGGFVSAGVDQPMTTMSPNEDVLICGFDRLQTRLIYSGNDIVPFNFFLINSELGSSSTFSAINMDKGVITRGNRGFTITSQVDCQRIDLEIPDQVFELELNNNGTERVCAQRDFENEWIHFTYQSNEDIENYKFPDQTLQFNYRDNSWAIINETYTTYGQFRPSSGDTWNSIDTIWDGWDDPWTAGETTLFQSFVIGGNQQGFVLQKNVGTSEETSLTIQDIVASVVTCPDHSLNPGDYIIISGVLGALGSQVNGKIFSVASPVENSFSLNPSIVGGTYMGGGLITRMYVPFIQTKQFPMAWEMARKTRLGMQQYLLSTTSNAQITLLIFLSQNSSYPYPDPATIDDGQIYSTILYTCPESTNLGLTPFNTNLQQLVQVPTGVSPSEQMWHRINTSLIGDTVQLGFTLSDAQMRTVDELGNPISQFAEINLHRIIIDISPSQLLS